MSTIIVGELTKMDFIRDAIHVSVCQVEATETLAPGQRVKFISPGTRRVSSAKANQSAVGIVDCFLSAPVLEGQIFWLFLYPNTTHSLRHIWKHPELPDDDNPDSYYGDDPECRSMGCN